MACCARASHACAQDTEALDFELPYLGLEVVSQAWVAAGGLLLAASAAPGILLACLPLGYLYHRWQVGSATGGLGGIQGPCPEAG